MKKQSFIAPCLLAVFVAQSFTTIDAAQNYRTSHSKIPIPGDVNPTLVCNVEPVPTYFEQFTWATKTIALSATATIAGLYGFKKLVDLLSNIPGHPRKVPFTFSAITGLDQEKQELHPFTVYLRNYPLYQKHGITLPQAIILSGDPSNGVNLLAQALAGETGYTLLSISANQFTDMFSGASRVQNIFHEAVKHSPSILVIEDIDTIATHPFIPGLRRYDSAYHALVHEITQLSSPLSPSYQKPIFVIGTTSSPQILDPTLFQKDCFETIISVNPPSTHDRARLLEIHSAHLRKNKDIDFEEIAKTIAGFSRDDCKKVIITAVFIMGQKRKSILSLDDIKDAIEKITAARNNIHAVTSDSANETFKVGPRIIVPAAIKEDFSMVAGIPHVKQELQTIVHYLKDPGHYTQLGAKIPRGILLEGKPGVGKTFIARALAKEANCPFFSVSGSDFVEKYVGVGAQRVRELFNEARKVAPSIIFIDEIDAVGGRRHHGDGGGHQEREQTLNQLLVEMDGFFQSPSHAPVIVIAATNRADTLDSALIRAGRFDQKIHIPYPSMQGRREILDVHCAHVPLDDTVDLDSIARGTPSFSGASLANLVNQAALRAANHNRTTVTSDDFEEARDTIIVGKENRHIVRPLHELTRTAYHESGHALMYLLMPETADPLHKVTIIARDGALGITWSLPTHDKYGQSREEMLAAIICGLGGRAAEDVVFHQLSTGAGSDFEKARTLAEEMVRYYGMSDQFGCVIYPEHGSRSPATQAKIDHEIEKIIHECYEKAKKLLEDNRDKLDLLAQTLLKEKTLHAADIYPLLGIPPRDDLRFNKDSLPDNKGDSQ